MQTKENTREREIERGYGVREQTREREREYSCMGIIIFLMQAKTY
jgi:hypothetical protein